MGFDLLLVVTMETFRVLSHNGKIRFQCVSMIDDLRHMEIINSISKLNKLRINLVTIIDI